MKIIKKKYIFSAIAVMAIVFFSLYFHSPKFAFADEIVIPENVHDWRPTCEIDREIEAFQQQNNDILDKVASVQKAITDFENDNIDYDSTINEARENFEYYEAIVEEMRPQIEETTKTSYATFFAKKLIDDVVGSEFITDWLFHLRVVSIIASSEDQEILDLIDDYCDAQLELNNAIEFKNNALQHYESNKQQLANLIVQSADIIGSISKLESMKNFVAPTEFVNGSAGESCIEGDGYFCHPCPGSVIVSNVGDQRAGYVHEGVDFANQMGKPIYAAADGIVIKTGSHETAGNFVKILHDNGLITTYMHCSKVFVPDMVRVKKGTNIALVGSTGDSTGPHLHFQTETKDGKVLNGLDYMKSNE